MSNNVSNTNSTLTNLNTTSPQSKISVSSIPIRQKLELRMLRSIFDDIDTNHNGVIEKSELALALKRLGLAHDVDQIDQLFQRFDTHQTNSIDFDEFVVFVSSREHQINEVFEELDLDRNGYLEIDEISVALDRLGMRYTNAELRKLVDQIDMNHDHRISYDEFRKFVMILPSINIRAIWNSHMIHNAIDIGESYSVPDEIQSREINFSKLFVSGGVAGAFSRTATAPFDRLKVIFQAGSRQVDQTSSGQKSPSLQRASSGIQRQEGWRGFFRGNGTNTVKIAPETGIKFLAYEKMKRQVCADPSHPLAYERLIAGAGAGVTAQTAIYPLEVVKTRLALSFDKEYRGIIDCLRSVYRAEGFKGLFRGLGPSLTGIVPYAGVDLAIYNTLIETQSQTHPDTKPSSFVVLASGATSSICGQIIAFPLQCIRTKLQAQGMKGRPHRYSGMSDCLRQTIANDGFIGLYRGILPNMLKAVPAISISYVAYENMKTFLIGDSK